MQSMNGTALSQVPAPALAGDNAVEVRNLVKNYGSVRAVRGISFAVARGEMVAMLGPNGAGKTTTLEIVEGLRRQDAGEVQVLGLMPARARRRIGVQLQEGALYDELSCAETLRHFARLYGFEADPQGLLRLVDLEGFADRRTAKLSGGQKRRLQLALALCNDPDVIILDEPTTGLDPVSRRQSWEMIKSFHRQGRTILLTTHYIEEAESLADRVIIVDIGQIVAQGSPRDLIEQLGAAVTIELPTPEGIDLSDCKGVSQARHDSGVWRLRSHDPGLALTDLTGRFGSRELRGIKVQPATLEDVFLAKTGHSLEEVS